MCSLQWDITDASKLHCIQKIHLLVNPEHVDGFATQRKEECQVFSSGCQFVKLLLQILVDGVGIVPASFSGGPPVLPVVNLVRHACHDSRHRTAGFVHNPFRTVRIKYRRIKTSRYVNKERLRELRFVHISAKVEMGLLFVANVKGNKNNQFSLYDAVTFISNLD